MRQTSRIYVAGGDTLIGAALREQLRLAEFDHLVGEPPNEPDLTDDRQVEDFFAEARPEFVFLTAGKVGGIRANQDRPTELMHHNLLVATHLMHAACWHGVEKLLYLASSCCYPKNTPQPLQPSSLYTGPVEETSAAYATAKLAGIELCRAYRRQFGRSFVGVIPANPFGPHDDFDPDTGHVISALIQRIHEAKERGQREVILWGTGKPRREFIYSRDLADACMFVMAHYDEPEAINLGSGMETSIAELAGLIAEVVGYHGRLQFDSSRPDGMLRKVLDSSKLFALGWRPKTDFRTALEETYAWFLTNIVKEESDVSATV
ncbi:MAG TPA: GDP-L-fucose synthase [Gemmataceae bacterium]|nr:GDP-L-fucose synthase [Gemmataceae bacterium]